MTGPHDHVTASGYDQETAYFRKQDEELLARKRAQLDAERARQAQLQSGHAHWMKCPKCGENLKEVEIEGRIKVDQCDGCGYIGFDKGELDLLISHKTQSGVMHELRKLFGK